MQGRRAQFETEARRPRDAAARRRLALALAASCAILAAALCGNPPAGATFSASGAAAQGEDYTRFRHADQTHANLPCLLCHKRADNSARPAWPGHLPCSGCHSQQFANPASPICTICHTDAQSGGLKTFPGLKTFNARFNHLVHTRAGARPREGCAACHRPTRGGVALSIPAGLGAHATCYQCHTARAQAGGRDLATCALCHQQGRHARTPERAAAYRVNFSHAKHGARQRLDCASCHTVKAGSARGRQVSAPQPLQHHASPRAQSCITCHNDRRAFGGDDFSDCKKCHTGNNWYFGGRE